MVCGFSLPSRYFFHPPGRSGNTLGIQVPKKNFRCPWPLPFAPFGKIQLVFSLPVCLGQVLHIVPPWAGVCSSLGLFLSNSLKRSDWLLKSLWSQSQNKYPLLSTSLHGLQKTPPHSPTTFFVAMELLQLFPGLSDPLSTNPLSQSEVGRD